MKIQKYLSFYLICFLFLLSSCEDIWNLPSLEPCIDATFCQIDANESTRAKLFTPRIFHQTTFLNSAQERREILVSGGTTKQDFGQFFNEEGGLLDDIGIIVPKEPSFIHQFAFNAIATTTNLTPKTVLAIGGIRDNLNLTDLDMPFDFNIVDFGDTTKISNRISIYNDNNNEWTIDKTSIHRAGHTATWLPIQQRVLLMGGNADDSRIELYNPVDSSSSISTTLEVNRAFHTATLFNDNEQVLIIGGIDLETQQATNVIEIYDVNSNSVIVKNTEEDFTPLFGHTVHKIKEKEVAIIGGYDGGKFSDEILIYNIEENNIKTTTLPTPLAYHSTTMLENGWLLIVGGRNLTTTEDKLMLFKREGNNIDLKALDCILAFPRYGHSTTLVNSDDSSEVKLLIIGGRNEDEAVLQTEMITLNLNCIEF
ncbi:MAG: Kelch repeat-containing protein [Chitinophagales bacterium]